MTGPSGSDTNAIWLPSGDQAGLVSWRGLLTRSTGFFSTMSITNTSELLVASDAYARRPVPPPTGVGPGVGTGVSVGPVFEPATWNCLRSAASPSMGELDCVANLSK